MKTSIFVLIVSLFLAPAFAADINERLDADSDGRIDIFNTAGSVAVSGWDRNSVEVTGNLGENVEELIFERDGDRITIKVKVPRNSSRRISSDLVVRVPENSSIDVSTISADIDVEALRGEQNLHTVSGDIEAEVFGGDVDIESVSGDASIEGGNGDNETAASTVSGDVTLLRVSGHLDVESVSGDIVVDEGEFERVGLETVNGDIVYRAGLREAGKLTAESVNGDVDIRFTGKVSARFDVETFNGDIDSCFGPEPERASRYAPGLELRFSEGDGEGRVTLSTLNGDLRICTD